MLDFHRLVEHIFPRDAIISVETDKNYHDNLDDFVMDVEWLKNLY